MKVIYEGVDIYPEISVSQCFHDMHAEGHADELLLRMNDTRQLWDVWQPKKGDSIIVSEGAATTGKMFIESIQPEAGSVVLRGSSVPPAAKNKNGKAWEVVRFLQLCKEIADRHDLKLEQYGVTEQVYKYVNQTNQSDVGFLRQRCILEGNAFLVFDGRLIVYSEVALEAATPTKSITITPASEFEYSDNGSKTYRKAIITNGTYQGVWSSKAGDQDFRKHVQIQMSSQPEANRFAKGILRYKNKYSQTGILPLALLAHDIAAGSIVNLLTEGAETWNGKAFVYRIRHEYVSRRSKIFFRRPLEDY